MGDTPEIPRLDHNLANSSLILRKLLCQDVALVLETGKELLIPGVMLRQKVGRDLKPDLPNRFLEASIEMLEGNEDKSIGLSCRVWATGVPQVLLVCALVECGLSVQSSHVFRRQSLEVEVHVVCNMALEIRAHGSQVLHFDTSGLQDIFRSNA